eukprot:GGOE01060796.1.p1 GENE.GGOE01060796.1~~GGOE01060796.1.p1  ORF type:complete len:131 (+),score=23.79 GGOE01060796.1:25-417(+)
MVLGTTLYGWGINLLLMCAAYQSFQAIQKKSGDKQSHWLTFWLLYGALQFLEIWADLIIMRWIPFYLALKFVGYAYLMSAGGAEKLYKAFGEQSFRKADDVAKQVHQRGLQNEHYKVLSSKLENVLDKMQ